MAELPKLTREDYQILSKLMKQNRMAFFTNVTNFFISQMFKYIKDARVWRCSIMGETRSGKSEVGHTICKLYVRKFNQLLRGGYFKKLDVFNSLFKENELLFDIKHIVAGQSDYIQSLRREQKANELNFGQIWQIDESRESTGGIGTYSEMLELQNLNNIIAKFMQSEIWITPLKFEVRNAPYGLFVYKKDIVNRVNWCLLYKIEMSATAVSNYHFLGWVKVPLHSDEAFRKLYNEKKNTWIAKEIEGSSDVRMSARKEVSKRLADDKFFMALSPTGKKFVLTKDQQIATLETWILEGKTSNWNEVERYRIVEEARMIVTRRKLEADMLKMEESQKEEEKKKEDKIDNEKHDIDEEVSE